MGSLTVPSASACEALLHSSEGSLTWRRCSHAADAGLCCHVPTPAAGGHAAAGACQLGCASWAATPVIWHACSRLDAGQALGCCTSRPTRLMCTACDPPACAVHLAAQHGWLHDVRGGRAQVLSLSWSAELVRAALARQMQPSDAGAGCAHCRPRAPCPGVLRACAALQRQRQQPAPLPLCCACRSSRCRPDHAQRSSQQRPSAVRRDAIQVQANDLATSGENGSAASTGDLVRCVQLPIYILSAVHLCGLLA